jgi:hypothetical protein
MGMDASSVCRDFDFFGKDALHLNGKTPSPTAQSARRAHRGRCCEVNT